MAKQLNYDTKMIIRISKEEREKIRNWSKENGVSISHVLRDYMKQLTNGGNQ